jgi:hypothetical protein
VRPARSKPKGQPARLAPTTAAKAPAVIVPSTPRLSVPLRSTIVSPTAAPSIDGRLRGAAPANPRNRAEDRARSAISHASRSFRSRRTL